MTQDMTQLHKREASLLVYTDEVCHHIPKVTKEVGGILKFKQVHKSPPHSALFYQKMTLKYIHIPIGMRYFLNIV